MQPTTLCNLDCAYCYLPFRADDRRMPVAVAAAVAESVNAWAATGRFSVVWHGGEPLAAGRARAGRADGPVRAGVEHHVQTNATLIDDAWCEFFAEHEMRVSVSVDGPRERNADRVNRGGAPAYDRILRGIETLRRHGLPFSALCVVCEPRAGAGRASSTTTSSTWAATCSASTSRRQRASTPGPTRRRRRRCAASGPSWWRPGGGIRGSTCARSSGRCGTPAAVLDGTADDVLPRALDPIPTIAARRLGGPALARVGRLQRSPLRRLHQSGNVLTTRCRDPGRRRDVGALGAGVPRRGGGVPGALPLLRVLRRRPRGQPLLRARPVRRYRDRPLPQQQDPPTGGSAGPCPRHQ